MERVRAKEKGRKKLIRDRADTLKETPPRKAPAKSVIKQAGRYHAIEMAKKQLNEARQAVVPDQEQQPYTATDEVESYAINVANKLSETAPSFPRYIKDPNNPFHHETDCGRDISNKLAPIEQARQKAIRELKQRKKAEQNAFHRETNTGQPAFKAQLVKERGRSLARERAIQDFKIGKPGRRSGRAAKASGDFRKKLGAAVTKAVTPERGALLYAAGALVLIVVPFVLIIGVASMLTSSGEGRNAYIPVSAEVEAYRPLIRCYAAQYGIPEYEDLIAAVMMQESGGRGSDPMQASESGYNTRYTHAPNSITDSEYSIEVGVHTLADVLNMASVESPIDLDHISLALHGYNFGPSYITWALANYGGYSKLNAIEFSDIMAVRYGWDDYGDKAYVPHVLRYYPIGRAFMNDGDAAMVAVALSQLGNVGGEPYWSWYGYNSRVAWCAIFVSWCADQCGYLDISVLPKMEGVCPYVDWFIERGQWQGRDYEPMPGDIIFFDWENDGLADHVGIVEKVENGLIYTVEGNSGDRCSENRYYLGSAPIYGFGLPLY